jgi:hypothetical protein
MNGSSAFAAIMVSAKPICLMLFTISVLPKAISQEMFKYSKRANRFRVDGELELNEKKEKAVCILRETGKKEFSINDSGYEKFSEHIGHYPCVIIALTIYRSLLMAAKNGEDF